MLTIGNSAARTVSSGWTSAASAIRWNRMSLPGTRCRSATRSFFSVPCSARDRAVGAGQAVVDVDPVGRDAQADEGLVLDSQVLRVCRAPGMADLESGHPSKYRRSAPHHRAISRAAAL